MGLAFPPKPIFLQFYNDISVFRRKTQCGGGGEPQEQRVPRPGGIEVFPLDTACANAGYARSVHDGATGKDLAW